MIRILRYGFWLGSIPVSAGRQVAYVAQVLMGLDEADWGKVAQAGALSRSCVVKDTELEKL